jgi:hypothetical protein
MKRNVNRILWVGVLAVAATLSAAPVQAQVTLRYKFKEGDKLNYVMEQKMDMTMNNAGNESTVTMTQKMDMTWKVTAVDKDGTAKITQTIDRVHITMDTPPPGGKTEFDSKDDKEPTDPVGKMIAPIFKAMVGAEFTLTMTPRGEAKDVVVPQKLLDAVEKAGPAAGGMTPDVLKQMASQGGLVLPEKALKKGDTWTPEPNKLKMEPLGTMTVKTEATYEGEVTKDGKKLEQIALKPKMTLEAPANATTKMTLKKQDNKGTALFDSAKGQLAETTMEMTMDMEIVAGGQTVNMKQKQAVSMKLK